MADTEMLCKECNNDPEDCTCATVAHPCQTQNCKGERYCADSWICWDCLNDSVSQDSIDMDYADPCECCGDYACRCAGWLSQ